MISLRQHVDRAGGIGHDLLSQPVLEGRDHPVIAIVDDQEGVPRLRPPPRPPSAERTPAVEPGTGCGPPGRDRGGPGDPTQVDPQSPAAAGSCGIGWSLSLTWNVVAPVPRILRGSIPSREPESRDLPAGCRSRRPLNRWERHVTGMIYPEKLDLPRRFFWARPIGSCQNGHGSMASEQFLRSQN